MLTFLAGVCDNTRGLIKGNELKAETCQLLNFNLRLGLEWGQKNLLFKWGLRFCKIILNELFNHNKQKWVIVGEVRRYRPTNKDKAFI